MPTNVVMPQMGESIAEGTIVRWIKKIGDNVDRDEPLFEISTDKVDAEIPAPSAGVLSEIKVKEGETVAVNTVVAVINHAGEKPAPPPAAQPQPDGAQATAAPPAEEPTAWIERATSGQVAATPRSPDGGAQAATVTLEDERETEEVGKEDLRRQKSSPVVRRIAREHDIDIGQLRGTGISGRVTKQDILKYLETRSAPPAQAPAAAPATAQAPEHVPAFRPGESVEIVPMSVMRKRIAEHMVLSKRTSAHVHSVFEVDFSRVAKIREAKRAEYERAGTKLTYLSFIALATMEALRAFPVINSSIDGDKIVYKKEINLGIAVALDWGLIVPVIRNADEKNIRGLSRAIEDLATRARAKQLKPEEVQGGTFTITNPGTFGAQFGMPIINQPQVAILGVGAIEKRAVVVDDAIAIRPRAYLTLGYDHRLIDGAVADQFMSHLKAQIENFDERRC